MAGLFVDAEDFVCDLVSGCPAVVGLQVVTWLPADFEQRLDAGEAFVVLQRTGGAATMDAQADNAIIDIGVVAHSRAQAWGVMGQIRAWLLSDAWRAAAGLCSDVHEVSGPVQPMWANPDDRWVHHIFQFTIRRRR